MGLSKCLEEEEEEEQQQEEEDQDGEEGNPGFLILNLLGFLEQRTEWTFYARIQHGLREEHINAKRVCGPRVTDNNGLGRGDLGRFQ